MLVLESAIRLIKFSYSSQRFSSFFLFLASQLNQNLLNFEVFQKYYAQKFMKVNDLEYAEHKKNMGNLGLNVRLRQNGPRCSLRLFA